MPHKKNPNLCERITGLARLLRGYAVTGYENVALWHERDISHSSVERVSLADASILLDYMLSKMSWIIENLVVNTDRMQRNLASSNGMVFSGTVLLALTQKGMSREDAYRHVQSAAMRAWDQDTQLLEELRGNEEVAQVLSQEELAECFTVDRLLRNVDHIFARCGLD